MGDEALLLVVPDRLWVRNLDPCVGRGRVDRSADLRVHSHSHREPNSGPPACCRTAEALVDISNPFNADASGLVTTPGNSAAQEIAAAAPEGTAVVKALNTTKSVGIASSPAAVRAAEVSLGRRTPVLQSDVMTSQGF